MKKNYSLFAKTIIALLAFVFVISGYNMTVFADDCQGHVRNDGIVTREPSCTEPGIIAYSCIYCGADMGVESINPISHVADDGEVVLKATCTQNGTVEYKCIYCRTILATDSIPATEHVSDGGTVEREPAIGVTGLIVYRCANCGTVLGEDVLPAIEKRDVPRADFNTSNCVLSNIPSDCTVKVNNALVNDSVSGSIDLSRYLSSAGSYTISVRANSYDGGADSESQLIQVTKPSAPWGIAATSVSHTGAPGYISGINSNMEYALKDSGNWNTCPDGQLQVSTPGIYLVRYRATVNTVKSDAVEVLIKREEAVKPATPNAYFNGTTHRLEGVYKGMAYSTNAGDNWNYISMDLSSVELSMDQIRQAASYGYLFVKNTVPIDSDIQRVTIGRQSAPADLISYDASGNNGMIKGVAPDMEYRKDGSNVWVTINGYELTGLNAGTYYVRRRASGYLAESKEVGITVRRYGDYGNTKGDTPSATFNAYNMVISGVSGCRLSYDGGKSYTDTLKVDALNVPEGLINTNYGLVLYRPGNGADKKDSDKQLITVTKSPYPTGITATSATATKLGSINGVDESMQYRSSSTSVWTDIQSGTSSVPVATGTYLLRRHGSNTALASDPVTIIIKLQ